MNFHYETPLPFSRKFVWDWIVRPGVFTRLIPPSENLTLVDEQGKPMFDQGIAEGVLKHFKIARGPITVSWDALHQSFKPGFEFVDKQVRGPFASFEHTHTLKETGPDSCVMIDSIDLSGVATIGARGLLEKNFQFRAKRIVADLALHARYADLPRLKIGITGASGMIGSQLLALFRSGGNEVYPFVRRRTGGEQEIYWNPETQEIETEKMRKLDVVIHLAGENLADHRWTDAFKQKILKSRVDGTRLISEALASFSDRKRKFIAASAIGFYGDTDDRWVDEQSKHGTGFLAEVCQNWESAIVASEHVTAIRARIGIVLSQKGGALQKLIQATRLGGGAIIGSGEQWMSWIALDDVLSAFYALTFDPKAQARVYNLVSPQPVQQKDFAKSLAKVLHRPTLLKLPRFAVQMGFGQMGEETVLQGQRVKNQALSDLGFEYRFPSLEPFFGFELN